MLPLSSTPIESPINTNLGETLLLSSGKPSARHRNNGSDPHGRWSYQRFPGKDQTLITFIICYQAANVSRKGKFTYASQLEASHRHNNTLKKYVKQLLMDGLSIVIKQLQDDNHKVSIIEDFNKAIKKWIVKHLNC